MPYIAVFDQGPLPNNPTYSGEDYGKRGKTQPPGICTICGAKLSKYRPKGEKVCASHPKVPVATKVPIATGTQITKQRTVKQGRNAVSPKLEYKASHRAGKKALEELDYHEVGFDSNGHLIMEHPYAGRLYVAGTPADIDGEVMRKVQKANRQLRLINSQIGDFVAYLRKKYNVPADSSVVVQTSLQAEIRKWVGSRSDISRVSASFARPVIQGGYVNMVKAGQGKNPSTIEIYGSEYVPPKITKTPTNADKAEQVEAATKSEPICGESHPTFPGVWCTDKPDHEGMHTSEAVESGWFTAKDEPRVPYYSKAAQVAAAEEPKPMLHPGVAIKEPIKAKVEPPIPVGVSSDTGPQVADVTSDLAAQKTPQKVGAITDENATEILRQLREVLAPNAYTNEQLLTQCKELVKAVRVDLDSAYEKVYALERILGL